MQIHTRKGRHYARVRLLGDDRARTFESKTDAKKWGTKIEARLHGEGRDDLALSRESTLSEAIEWREERIRREAPKSARVMLCYLGVWRGTRLAKLPLTAVSSDDLREIVDKWIDDGAGPQIVTHRLNVLSRLYSSWQLERSQPGLRNPVAPGIRPKLPPGRDRRLMYGEEARLLKALVGAGRIDMDRLVRLALATAARLGELLKIEWPDVDRHGRRLALKNTKNGLDRFAPLSRAGAVVIDELIDDGGVEGRVFRITSRHTERLFENACVATGIEDLHFHDLRHEAISRLFERTSLRDVEIMTITGHRSIEMLKRYSHLRSNDLADRMG